MGFTRYAGDDLTRFLTALDAALDAPAKLVVIADSTIAQIPDGFEERLVRVLPDLERLELYVLDRHDLAASKLIRGNEHDRQQLAQLHDLSPLDHDTLIARFRDLMADFVGDATEPWWALRHFVEEILGELAAAEIDEHRPRKGR